MAVRTEPNRENIMRTVVFLFPGTWGNDTAERVLWWFERPIEALLDVNPKIDVVPIVYAGTTFGEIVCDVLVQLRRYCTGDMRPVALAYGMGRQIFSEVFDILACPHFERVAHIAGVPRNGVPVLGTLDAFRAAPRLFLRSLGGTAMPASVDEVNRIMCSGTDEELAEEIIRKISPEAMYWKIAGLFLPGLRVTTPPIEIPVFATLGLQDAIVGRADYAGDNMIAFNRLEGNHAIIRKDRPDIRATWERQAKFLLEA